MGYRVNYRGLDVVVDALSDLDALADHVASANRDGQISTINLPAILRVPVEQSTKSLLDVIRASSDAQKKVFFLLVGSERSDSELRQALRLDNNQQLAGVFGGLSKRLLSSGFTEDAIITSEHVFRDGKRVYTYRLNPKSIDAVAEALGEDAADMEINSVAS
jgi:hypothetical protein